MAPKEPRVRTRMRFRAISIEVSGNETSVVQQLAAAMLDALGKPNAVETELVCDEHPPKRRRKPAGR